MADNTLKTNTFLNGDRKREGASVCLRSKRSEVRILSGVPQTLGLAAADLLPGRGKSENNASKTLASCPPKKRDGIRAWLEYHRGKRGIDRSPEVATGAARIRLSGGFMVTVDLEDLPTVNRYKWRCTDWRRQWNYAKTGRGVLMHRLLLGAKPGEIVDHINGDTLDNRKSNLRICTTSDNSANSRKYRGGGSSQFKGVYWTGKHWRAQICVKRKKINLGSFGCEKQAAEAYDRAAVEKFGRFARTNFKVVVACA